MEFLTKRFLIIGFIACFAGCSGPKTLDLEGYIQWYYAADCEMKITKEIGDYTFVSEYRPLDFVVVSELQKSGSVNQESFDSLKNEFDGMHYFLLRIKTSDPSNDMLSFRVSNSQEYYNRVQYFSESAQHDFSLISESDTFECVLYHFERTYNSSPYNNLIVGFEKTPQNTNKPLKLVFNDRVLGNGMVLFTYSESTLSHIPQLTL